MVSQARSLSGQLDPFGNVSVRMNQPDTALLLYCKYLFRSSPHGYHQVRHFTDLELILNFKKNPD